MDKNQPTKTTTVLGKLATIGLKIIAILSVILATTLVVYGGYALWDNVYTSRAAYATHDLTRYKPSPIQDGEDDLTLEKIQEVNDDAVAWLTIYNTNIDYPVVQGENDLEYANKDVYGNASLTGTIYLSSENNSFEDPYCMVYGHHIDNGAMFGDLDKYTDPAFFDSHREGILITPEQVYDLEIFACVATDAYDRMIYSVANRTDADIPLLVNYIRDHAEIFKEDTLDGYDHLVALSTCADEETYGRNVIFAKKTEHDGPLPEQYETIEDPRTPLALNTQGRDYWALLNLICMILTVYMFFPIHRLWAKYKRRKMMEECNEDAQELIVTVDDTVEESDENGTEEILYDEKEFRRKSRIGVVLEVVIAIISVIAFILTENILLPMTIIDRWTPLMILILTVCWVVDVWLVRYRDKRTEETAEDEE